MSYQSEVERLNKKIDEITEKLRQAFKDGKSMARRSKLRAELDNLCEERDFYKRKIREGGEMMREIKFRAWDKGENRMLYQDDTLITFDYSYCSLEDILHYHKGDFELMQYTGLKDCNGEEIYEGDIIKYNTRFKQLLCLVYYNKKDAGYYLKVLSDKDYEDLRMMEINEKDYEIVGNEFEAPELLI